MTLRNAITVLYEEATSEDRTHPLEQINEAKEKLLHFVELLEKENFKIEQAKS